MQLKNWIGIWIVYVFCLHAAEESMTIQSGEALYNGQDISLSGQVLVEHPLGQIASKYLILMPSGMSPSHRPKFAMLKIHDDVVINWAEGGCLHCQEALIDSDLLTGMFQGNAEQPNVIYEMARCALTSQSEKAPVRIQSHKMHVQLEKREREGQAPQTVLRCIQADDKVQVKYAEKYTVLASHANYQQDNNVLSQRIISLYPDSSSQTCQLIHENGDTITSDSILIDLDKQELFLNQSKGTIHVEGEKPYEIQFSADKLIWDENQHLLTLQDHVCIKQPGLGDIYTDQKVQIQQEVVEGKLTVRKLTFPSGTRLNYLDVKRGSTHQMVCHGVLEADPIRCIIQMKSPIDSHGQVLDDQQVYFEDVMGEMYADQVEFHYQTADQGIIPIQLSMRGHVKVFNRFNGHPDESGSVLQYALADRVDYRPSEQEMLLTSQKGHRVLFFDKINNLKMSAPSLKIRKDKQSQKESIQGLGDVRFTFMESEFEEFKKRFKFTEASLEK